MRGTIKYLKWSKERLSQLEQIQSDEDFLDFYTRFFNQEKGFD